MKPAEIRASFETWAATTGYNLEVHSDGSYVYYSTIDAWNGWQAAVVAHGVVVTTPTQEQPR